jgi:uncharacterized membrane protein YhiD involved in acid resistance
MSNEEFGGGRHRSEAAPEWRGQWIRGEDRAGSRRAGTRGVLRHRSGGRPRRPSAFVLGLGAGLLTLILAAGDQTWQVRAHAVAAPATSQAAPSKDRTDESFFSRLFEARAAGTLGHESLPQSVLGIVARFALAAGLAALLAYRRRKDLPLFRRDPSVAQTQILLAVVAAAMMMVVADNAARAFAIFAAASLVRFRTNIRDPKEITVLLVSLGIGLAAGVGRWEIAAVFTLFILLLLWVLEYYQPAQVFRAMELKVKTRDVDETDEALRRIFRRHRLNAELRKIDREDGEDPLGTVLYFVRMSPEMSTDRLSEEVFSGDPRHVDSVEWDQKKGLT